MAQLYFSENDVALLIACAIVGLLGSLIRAWTSELDLTRPPPYESIDADKVEKKSKRMKTGSSDIIGSVVWRSPELR